MGNASSKRPGLLKILAIFLIFGAITVGLEYINLWLGILAMVVLSPLSADLFRGVD